MTDEKPSGPDLARGVTLSQFEDDKLLGHVGEEAVLLVRRGDQIFAIGALCTHYHGPLAEGLLAAGTVHCPWHHACFDLATGEALHAPAIDPLSCWAVEQRGGKIFVGEKRDAKPKGKSLAKNPPDHIVILGGGAAGFAAAEMLRRQNYGGSITMLSSDDAPPVDRPNLSKDYLAGSAPEDWMPLRPGNFYTENHIDLRLNTPVASIERSAREVALKDGSRISYDRLLLATGAEPIRLSVPGADGANVFTLRSLSDSRAIIAASASARRAVVMGASFIGLEVAASLRTRGLEVHVVAPEKIPMEKVLGPQMGSFVRALHEEHGVIFHLEDVAVAIEGKQVRLKSGRALEADLVIAAEMNDGRAVLGLLLKGVDPNLVDSRGRTPLFFKASMYLAEVPKCVMRSASAYSHSTRPRCTNGDPSNSSSTARDASAEASQFHIIQPHVVK